MSNGNHVKTQSMKFTGHLTIDIYRFKKMNPPPLKSHSRINSYFQMNYSHCCTMIQCLKYNLRFFVSLIDQLIHSSVCRHPKGHVALDRNPGPGFDTLLMRLISGYL